MPQGVYVYVGKLNKHKKIMSVVGGIILIILMVIIFKIIISIIGGGFNG